MDLLNGKGGKRGFRLYPPWITPSNKQAQKTQAWQIPYFYETNGQWQDHIQFALLNNLEDKK